jgi:hypothetical protein
VNRGAGRGRGRDGKPPKKKRTATYWDRLTTHVRHRLRFHERRRHQVQILALVDKVIRFQRIGQWCEMSQAQIAADLGCHERTVRRYVAVLLHLGVLEVIASPAVYDPTTETWSRPPNVYRLKFSQKPPAGPANPQVTPTGQKCPVLLQFVSLTDTSYHPPPGDDPGDDPPPHLAGVEPAFTDPASCAAWIAARIGRPRTAMGAT